MTVSATSSIGEVSRIPSYYRGGWRTLDFPPMRVPHPFHSLIVERVGSTKLDRPFSVPHPAS
jgi:hypothetical protein